MKRKIISIDEARCNGCGLCVSACHEGAIQLVNGKAKLISDSYCDGLGDCLPACPVNAIRIIEREAADYDEAAVAARKTVSPPPLPCGCPGQMAKTIVPKAPVAATPISGDAPASQLTNWPVQIKLVNPRAPYLQNAALLIAADCTAFAYPDIHRMFMRNKVTLIGCPQRHQERRRPAHGSALLRRHRKRHHARAPGLRQNDPLAGRDDFHRRRNP
jgi:ferredoxin